MLKHLVALVFCPSRAFFLAVYSGSLCLLHRCKLSFAQGFHLVLPVDIQMPLMLASSKTSLFCHGASIKQVAVPSDTGLQETQGTSSHTNGLHSGNKKSCKTNHQIFIRGSSKFFREAESLKFITLDLTFAKIHLNKHLVCSDS